MKRLLLICGFALVLVQFASAKATQPPCDRDHLSCPQPVPRMGRLVTSGAETGAIGSAANGEGLTTLGTPIVSSPVRTGSFAYSSEVNGLDAGFTTTVGVTYFVRAYIYIDTLPGGNDWLIQAANSTPAAGYNVGLQTDGTLQLRHGATTQVGSSSAALSLNTWYRVELSWTIGAGSGDDSAELRLDGVMVASESGATMNTVGTIPRIGGGNAGGVVYTDDIAINDNQGANQNTWPGEGKVVLLKPISDSAKGTGWVNDANAAANFFDATNNTPPVGIADTTASTGLHQIRNATSNANSSYDANLTTYTNAGIAAADTINLLVPVVATGAPVTTSAKQGTVGVSSNPVIANVALGAGGTAGAFWSGVAAGTYPTGWKWSFGTTTYAPSVTKGNSPVARITQVTSSTRIAMVCALGMYVDYTPVSGTTYTKAGYGVEHG